jgi:hypothetical protein
MGIPSTNYARSLTPAAYKRYRKRRDIEAIIVLLGVFGYLPWALTHFLTYHTK